MVRKSQLTSIQELVLFHCCTNILKGTDLIRPALTRFATSYLTLGCLNDNKGSLIRMFTYEEWQSSQFVKTRDEGFDIG